MGELFGGMGELADDFLASLSRPATQAKIIGGTSSRPPWPASTMRGS